MILTYFCFGMQQLPGWWCVILKNMLADDLKADFSKALPFLKELISPACRQAGFEHPKNVDHGDFSSSVALKLFPQKDLWQSKKEFANINTPIELAQKLVILWRGEGLPDYVGKVEVLAPGFINISLSEAFLLAKMEQVLQKKDNFGRQDNLKGKKILLEHTSPNPQTTIMLGHLRNNFLGMSVARLLEFAGAEVTKDCLVNDRGVHLCRAMWGYLVFAHKKNGLSKTEAKNFKDLDTKRFKSLIAKRDWRDLLEAWKTKKADWYLPLNLGLKPDHANLIWYVLGSRAYKESPDKIEDSRQDRSVKSQVDEMLLAWEEGLTSLIALWQQILTWSGNGYRQTYQRIGSQHDHFWYESEFYQQGKKIVEEGLAKKIFKKSQGAVVTDLKKYNLPDTVVAKSDGTALYITQDLALTKLKKEQFPSHLYIWVVGEEQKLALAQVFAVCQQLGIGKQGDFFHLHYGLINFKGGGKMSTRSGNVVMADQVLDQLEDKVSQILKTTDQKLRGKLDKKERENLLKAVALGAVKYGLLAPNRDSLINFDIERSVSLKGNSGPYLQYTYSRAKSVLAKVSDSSTPGVDMKLKLEKEDKLLLQKLYRFEEMVAQAAKEFDPSLVAGFAYDLSEDFNLFYDRQPILKALDLNLRSFRLKLVEATAQVLKNSLSLLGIEAVERM